MWLVFFRINDAHPGRILVIAWERGWCILHHLFFLSTFAYVFYALLRHFDHVLRPYAFLLRFYLEPPRIFSLLGLFLLSYYLCVFLHEGGHALSACVLRYRVLCFAVGPFKVEWRRNHYYISWQKGFQIFAGYVNTQPCDMRHLRLREILVIAGGPSASLLQAGICLVCLSFPGLKLSFSLIWFFRITAGIALLGAVGNCFPLQTCQGALSDGAALFLYLKGGPPMKRWLAIDALSIQIEEGKLPLEWNRQYLQQAICAPENSLQNLAGYTFAYCRALEEGDVAQARAYLERRLVMRKRMPAAQRRWLVLEAAYFEARYHHNVQAARTWFASAKNSGKGSCARLRAEAAVLFAEDEKEAARLCIEKGLEAAEDLLSLGAERLAKRWLHDLANVASDEAYNYYS